MYQAEIPCPSTREGPRWVSGFQLPQQQRPPVMGRSPSAEPAATGSGEGRTGDTRHSHLGCRTDSAPAAQASGSGRDLGEGEGRGGLRVAVKKGRCKREGELRQRGRTRGQDAGFKAKRSGSITVGTSESHPST